MKGHSPQNIWILLLLLLAGVVLGGFFANLFGGFSGLGWLAYGSSFGLTSPLVLYHTLHHRRPYRHRTGIFSLPPAVK